MNKAPSNDSDTFTLGEIGGEISGSGKQFFENVVLDNIWESMVELTAAVWTYRDRSIILERVLQDVVGDGKDIAALIEAYEPSEEDNAARTAERAELVSNVFRSFSRRPGEGGVGATNIEHTFGVGE